MERFNSSFQRVDRQILLKMIIYGPKHVKGNKLKHQNLSVTMDDALKSGTLEMGPVIESSFWRAQLSRSSYHHLKAGTEPVSETLCYVTEKTMDEVQKANSPVNLKSYIQLSGSIKLWEVLEWLHNQQLLKNSSAPYIFPISHLNRATSFLTLLFSFTFITMYTISAINIHSNVY
jgi:hypothetical protein